MVSGRKFCICFVLIFGSFFAGWYSRPRNVTYYSHDSIQLNGQAKETFCSGVECYDASRQMGE